MLFPLWLSVCSTLSNKEIFEVNPVKSKNATDRCVSKITRGNAAILKTQSSCVDLCWFLELKLLNDVCNPIIDNFIPYVRSSVLECNERIGERANCDWIRDFIQCVRQDERQTFMQLKESCDADEAYKSQESQACLNRCVFIKRGYIDDSNKITEDYKKWLETDVKNISGKINICYNDNSQKDVCFQAVSRKNCFFQMYFS